MLATSIAVVFKKRPVQTFSNTCLNNSVTSHDDRLKVVPFHFEEIYVIYFFNAKLSYRRVIFVTALLRAFIKSSIPDIKQELRDCCFTQN